MTQQNDNCVFCRICNEEEQSEILYKEDVADGNEGGSGVCNFFFSVSEDPSMFMEQLIKRIKDNEYVVFPDIKPAARHHYLIVTRKHIGNAKQLTVECKSVVEKLVQIAKQVLNENGADLSDVRFGFHWPPFNSIQHLHLHAISPASSMSFVSRLIFRPDSWWFVSPEYVTSRL